MVVIQYDQHPERRDTIRTQRYSLTQAGLLLRSISVVGWSGNDRTEDPDTVVQDDDPLAPELEIPDDWELEDASQQTEEEQLPLSVLPHLDVSLLPWHFATILIPRPKPSSIVSTTIAEPNAVRPSVSRAF